MTERSRTFRCARDGKTPRRRFVPRVLVIPGLAEGESPGPMNTATAERRADCKSSVLRVRSACIGSGLAFGDPE